MDISIVPLVTSRADYCKNLNSGRSCAFFSEYRGREIYNTIEHCKTAEELRNVSAQ